MLPMVRLIRNDPDIGCGTCSSWDECYSDEELIEELNWIHAPDVIRTPQEGLKLAKEVEQTRKEHEEDIRGTAW